MGFKVLGLDASGPMMTVGLVEDGQALALFSARMPRAAGSLLAPWIGEQVRYFGKPDGLVVGVGPGSFTGVRVAIATAKALAWAWNIPVKGVSSLACWAWSAPVGSRVIVTSERRGPAFYLGDYFRGKDGPKPLSPDRAISGALPPNFPLSVAVWVLGPAGRDPAVLQQIGPRAEPLEADLSGVNVALEGWFAVQWGRADDPLSLAPRYLREPAVSVRRAR
ncbi:MAG: tRNA (adenosine(37)-N6)-threonylcarbamoyltransferase complex dimerization subunit type 1 TsaB [Firmicutes bacterium]|nr:tRNA (adenosine(37)-N6)-threonylcarbamoyltransferase complex dimerization subunit type 1 TsaB [Bacillota bacterium]